MRDMIIYDFTRDYGHRPDRTGRIEVVTIHSLQGGKSALAAIDGWYRERIAAGRSSCSNYAISFDGKIGLYVPENKRAATSSSSRNDDRALTIECATGKDAPLYTLFDETRGALVDLLVDICRRYKKSGLRMLGEETKWDVPQNGALGVTLHRWFSDTDCPGNDILNQLPGIISEVNERLKPLYRVQLGAYGVRSNAEKKLKTVKDAGFTNAFIATFER